MSQRPRFTKEFKQEAVRLMRDSGRSASAIARELGIPRTRLYKWAEQMERHGAAAFPGSGRRSGTEAEVARLRQEIARLTEERDILKKAARYWAKESG
jgi:transposase